MFSLCEYDISNDASLGSRPEIARTNMVNATSLSGSEIGLRNFEKSLGTGNNKLHPFTVIANGTSRLSGVTLHSQSWL